MSNLTDQQKAELEKKIRDSIPNDESRELKFGCLLRPKVGECMFMYMAEDKDFIQVVNTFAMENELFHRDGNHIEWIWKEKGGNKDIVTFTERFEILGRPLNISDAICALMEAWDEEGKHDIDRSDKLMELINLFDYPKPYHEQSEDLFLFLYQLLCND